MTVPASKVEKQPLSFDADILAKMGTLFTRVVAASQLATLVPDIYKTQLKETGFYIAVLDERHNNQAAAFCRLVRSDQSPDSAGFESARNFGSDCLIASHPDQCFLEIGPFAFLSAQKRHRCHGLLWQSIASYCQKENIDYVIGCMPFKGKYPAVYALALSYLHHNYRAQPDFLAKAKSGVTMDIMPAEAINPEIGFASLPPVLRYCLRHGAKVGDGVVVDHSLEQIKLFVIVPAKKVGLH